MVETGFTEINIRTFEVERKLGAAEISIPAEIEGNPVGAEVAKHGPDTLRKIVQDVKNGLSGFTTKDGFAVPQSTFLFEAVVRKQ